MSFSLRDTALAYIPPEPDGRTDGAAYFTRPNGDLVKVSSACVNRIGEYEPALNGYGH